MLSARSMLAAMRISMATLKLNALDDFRAKPRLVLVEQALVAQRFNLAREVRANRC